MSDKTPTITGQTIIASADYKSVDPTAVTLQVGAANSVTVSVIPTAQTGSGNTVTVTFTDADTSTVLGTTLVITAGATGTKKVAIPAGTHRVTVTCVGTGTRTTLNYSVSAVWDDITYAKGVYWDGKAYATNEKALH